MSQLGDSKECFKDDPEVSCTVLAEEGQLLIVGQSYLKTGLKQYQAHR